MGQTEGLGGYSAHVVYKRGPRSHHYRCSFSKTPPTWYQSKRGHFNQEIGRSKGGLTIKIHAVVDALGNPFCIHFTAGNVNDIVPACGLIKDLPTNRFLADKAYDANALLTLADIKTVLWLFLQCQEE